MSLHSEALATLTAWAPPTPAQDRLRARFVRHLERHDDGLSRNCRPDHITASTLVLSPDLGSALLTLHGKAGQWFQLGGHCEPGDRTLAAAASREAAEESGLDHLALDPIPVQLSEHLVPFCGPAADVRHLDVRFVAVARSGAEPAITAESLDLRWWPVETLPTREPDVVELVRLARERAQESRAGESTRAAADHPSR